MSQTISTWTFKEETGGGHGGAYYRFKWTSDGMYLQVHADLLEGPFIVYGVGQYQSLEAAKVAAERQFAHQIQINIRNAWAPFLAAHPIEPGGMPQTLQELQRDVNQWQRETFGPMDPDIYLGKTGKEVDELFRAGLRKAETAEEAADVVIALMGLCGSLGIDLSAAIAAKMEKNWAREWQEQGDGTYQHKGDEA